MPLAHFERLHFFTHRLIIQFPAGGLQFPELDHAEELSGGPGDGFAFAVELSEALDLAWPSLLAGAIDRPAQRRTDSMMIGIVRFDLAVVNLDQA